MTDALPPLVIDPGPAIAEAVARGHRAEPDLFERAVAGMNLSEDNRWLFNNEIDKNANSVAISCVNLGIEYGLAPAEVADIIAQRIFRSLYARSAA